MVMDFQLPSLWRLVDMALPTPEPRSKFTFTLPSDSSRDKKSFCRQKNHKLIFVYTVYIYMLLTCLNTVTTHHIFSGQIHEQSLRGEGAELKGDGGNVGVPSGGSSHGSVTFTVQLDCPFTVWPLGAAKRQTIFISHLFLNLKKNIESLQHDSPGFHLVTVCIFNTLYILYSPKYCYNQFPKN